MPESIYVAICAYERLLCQIQGILIVAGKRVYSIEYLALALRNNILKVLARDCFFCLNDRPLDVFLAGEWTVNANDGVKL